MDNSKKTWKQAFAEVNTMHLEALRKQEEILMEKVTQKYGKFGPMKDVVHLIEFDHNHTWITDPTLDETGRFEVDPVEYYKESYIKGLKSLL